MVDYHDNLGCAGLVLGDKNDRSKDGIFDSYGPKISAQVDGLLKPHADSVPFAAYPNTPQTIVNLTNIGVARYYHTEIGTNNEVILKNLKTLWEEALQAAINDLHATAVLQVPQSGSASIESPLINEDDYNGINSDVGRTI